MALLSGLRSAIVRKFRAPEPLPLARVYRFADLLAFVEDPRYTEDVGAQFDTQIVNAAEDMRLIRFGTMGTDAEYWTVTRLGEATLKALRHCAGVPS